jgi:hypothetical protein
MGRPNPAHEHGKHTQQLMHMLEQSLHSGHLGRACNMLSLLGVCADGMDPEDCGQPRAGQPSAPPSAGGAPRQQGKLILE